MVGSPRQEIAIETMNGILSALILTLIAGSATGLGGALVLFKKKLSSNFLAAALGLSAGVMIFISLAEMFPQAQAEIMGIEDSPTARHMYCSPFCRYRHHNAYRLSHS